MTDSNAASFDPDATIMSGASARKVFQRSALQSDATVRAAEAKSIDLKGLSGLNPLVGAACPLLALVPQLRTAISYADIAGLRDLLLRQVAGFEQVAKERNTSGEHIQAAKYALCALVDESISLTPWGGSGQWARNSLQVTFYREVAGGEKFFLLLGKMAEDPAKNLNILELMYVCLALGFEGRYRVADNGKAQLDELRDRLFEMIRKQRGEPERSLSVNWKGLQTSVGRTVRFLPLWVTAAVTALLLAGVFFGLIVLLNQSSDSLFGTLAKLKVPVPPPTSPAVEVVVKPVAPRLSKFLEEEIKQGLVAVKEDETTSLVSIRGDGLFDSGSATVSRGAEPVIDRIGNALNNVAGQVLVTGHTDDQPIRSARFPSNWHLSQERASSVARLLSRSVKDPGRLKSEGRADAEPVAGNQSADGRAQNRRVDVVLRVAEP